MPDLLIELFCEEIPARMQKNAAGNLRKLVTDKLVDAGLTYEGAKEYWTPRRLTLDVRGVAAKSMDVKEERKGPRTDAPQKAIEGFMRGAGLSSIDQAEVRTDPKKGDFYVAVMERPGRPAQAIIGQVVAEVIQTFPWPKSMRWGEASREAGSLKWVRPLQSILCVFGPETEETEVIEFEVSGLKSSNVTYGHRFHAPEPISVVRFEDYVAKLAQAKVVLDAEARKQSILTDAQNLAFAQGLDLVEDAGLLEEVAGLVEWPVVLIGQFEQSFLEIPKEVVQLTIRENQKCFVLKRQGEEGLVNQFVVVSNIDASDGGGEIARGNGKVVNARLADAKFFWESDLALVQSQDGFTAWNEKLDSVTFHAKLGSLGARVKRLEAMAEKLAPIVGAEIDLAVRAAHLCKADLNSAMVFEFPEVQGLMGRYYAERAGEASAVARAIEEHYKPLGPSDDVPGAPVSMALSLAEKLDTLIEFWAIDEKPTGSKDPYALRRAALGIIRLVLENEIALPLSAIGVEPDLLSFFHDRLKVYLRDKGIRHDLIDAVLTAQADDLLTVTRKARALQALMDSDDGANLLAGYKRAANILSAETKKNTMIAEGVSPDLLSHGQEQALYAALMDVEERAAAASQGEDFETAMSELARLREPIDGFFEEVLVNDDDLAVRANRLALLNQIVAATRAVGDFGQISG